MCAWSGTSRVSSARTSVDHRPAGLLGDQELRAPGELVEALAQRQALLGLGLGGRHAGSRGRRAVACWRRSGIATAVTASTSASSTSARLRRLSRAPAPGSRAQQVEAAPRPARALASSTRAGRQAEPLRGRERLLDHALGRQLQLDRDPPGRRIGAEDPLGEVDLLGPKRRQPVHLEAQQLVQVLARRERQVEDLAQAEIAAQAHRDRPAAPLRLVAAARADAGRGPAHRWRRCRARARSSAVRSATMISSGAERQHQAAPAHAGRPGAAGAASGRAAPPSHQPRKAAMPPRSRLNSARHPSRPLRLRSPQSSRPGAQRQRAERAPSSELQRQIDHRVDDQLRPAARVARGEAQPAPGPAREARPAPATAATTPAASAGSIVPK